MKIITTWNATQNGLVESQGFAFAFGAFDGIHLGHQYLIRRLKGIAEEKGLKTALLAFSNHPLEVILNGRSVPRITSKAVRRELIESQGIDVLLELPFTNAIASLEPEAFVAKVLSIMPIKIWLAGEDVTFGKARRGNSEVLEILAMKSGFKVEFLRKKEFEKTSISSSSIRTSIAHGDFFRAQELLGRPYSIVCELVRGIIPGQKVKDLTLMLYVEGLALPSAGEWKVQVRPYENWRDWVPATLTIEHKPEFASLYFQDPLSFDLHKGTATIEIMFFQDL